ncbi:hypothetical protein EMPG_12526 [Blastomyces silverae]|uniref:Uncharacterized protein n=1 Tax=Blastomyces silverae TaxID=2060906 RepID=A0A0H1BLR7_9EURO|nr:hypothetical protein EMPG_12526 [Blastomyces silverae]
MVGFRFPNILHRKSRPRTTGDSSSPAEMAECNSPQQGSQQSDSQNPPGPSTQGSSSPSSQLSSALPSRPGAIAPASPLSSPTSGTITSRTKNASSRNNSKNNNIRRRPASVKRKSSDSTSRARTPTRNTDIPIPTTIHPSTPLPRPSSSSRSRSSTRAQKPHRTRHPSPRKPILKLPTAEVPGDHAQGRIFSPYTSQAATRDNTERNTFITRGDTAKQNDLGEMSPSARRRRNSAPSPMSAINYIISLSKKYNEELYGYEDESEGESEGEDESEGESKSEDGKREGKGKGKSKGTGTGTGTGTSGRSRSSSSHRPKHNNEQKEKKRKREKKKMVRFDHVDVHPYEVERGEESRFRFFSRRAGEGRVEAIGNEGWNENENGSERVGNRGVDVVELEMDLDLREYVMDIPDVIQG